MTLDHLSPFIAEKIRLVETYAQAPSLWQAEAADLAAAMKACDPNDADKTLGLLHRAQRVIRVHLLGIENSQEFLDSLKGETAMLWSDFTAPPVSQALQDSLADRIYNVTSDKDEAVIILGDTTRAIGQRLYSRTRASGAKFDVEFVDPVFGALAMKAATDQGVESWGTWIRDRRMTVTKRMSASYNQPTFRIPDIDKNKDAIFKRIYEPAQARVSSGAAHYTLTSIPTQKDAEVDGIPYEDYLTLFFEMCDQPWDAIKEAQAHLIKTLNAAKTLRFTNEDGTDLSMNVDGFTFCNSVVARNVPGSEVFSAPKIDSVEGRIVAKGRFPVRDEDGKLAENMTLVFEKGVLTHVHADQGLEYVEKTLSIDDDAKRVGEIGIGTNPHLKQHVASTLLAEKIGGSFHVALGRSYTMKDYLGDPVNVDNGNKSLLHWDITTMLFGKQGRIYADGNMIMDNGIFLDPALRVLNDGWKAVPFAQRPEYWQKKYPENPAPRGRMMCCL